MVIDVDMRSNIKSNILTASQSMRGKARFVENMNSYIYIPAASFQIYFS